jgi:hypothetical protein
VDEMQHEEADVRVSRNEMLSAMRFTAYLEASRHLTGESEEMLKMLSAAADTLDPAEAYTALEDSGATFSEEEWETLAVYTARVGLINHFKDYTEEG